MKKTGLFMILILSIKMNVSAQNQMIVDLLNDVRLDSLTNFVEQLTGEKSVTINGVTDTIKSRHYLNTGNEKAFQFMKSEFIRFGYQIDSMQFNPTGKNLFAIKTGYKYPNRKFILGAHYDNLPTDSIAPGADDNASGSSTVLEAGRVFANYNFPYTIVFALWDEEELGLLGSNAYVPTISSSNDTLIAYINADMLGWDGNNDSIADINMRNVANSSMLSDIAVQCNTIYDIQLNLHVVVQEANSSDYAPFWNNGYTAIGIDEEYHSDFNPYWHNVADSLAQFNLSFYQKCSKLIYATLANCALDTLSTLGIQELNTYSEINIFPNPVLSKLTINLKSPFKSNSELSISNILGNTIYSENLPSETQNISIETKELSLSKGIYFVNISSDGVSSTTKFVKE